MESRDRLIMVLLEEDKMYEPDFSTEILGIQLSCKFTVLNVNVDKNNNNDND